MNKTILSDAIALALALDNGLAYQSILDDEQRKGLVVNHDAHKENLMEIVAVAYEVQYALYGLADMLLSEYNVSVTLPEQLKRPVTKDQLVRFSDQARRYLGELQRSL